MDEYQREWRKTEAGRKYKRASKERWRKNNLPKARAHLQLWRAIQAGKISRSSCELCGAEPVHAHHYLGYEKEHILDVQWLCLPHHRMVHSTTGSEVMLKSL